MRAMWASLMTSEMRVVESGLFTSQEIDAFDTALRASRGSLLPVFSRLMQIELWLRTRPRRIGSANLTTKGGDSYALRET